MTGDVDGKGWRAWRVYALIVMGTLVGLELVIRVWDWTPRSGDFVTGDRLGMARYEYPAAGFGDLVPNQDGHWNTWFHRPYHVQTNSVGLRNVEEPDDEDFRILAVGDSQTFGVFLPNEDTWPAWTENYLRRHPSASGKVQVFNAGIVGYTIVDELAYLKDKGVPFRPKLVILGVFENDLRDLLKDRGGVRKRPRPPNPFVAEVKGLLRNSAVVQLGNRLETVLRRKSADKRNPADTLERTGWKPPSPDDPTLAQRFSGYFNEMASFLASHNVKLAVIFIPAAASMEPDKKPSAMEPVIRAAAAREGVPYLDLSPAFLARPDAASRLYLLKREPAGELTGDGHLSREGNAVVGELLAEWLMKMGLPGN